MAANPVGDVASLFNGVSGGGGSQGSDASPPVEKTRKIGAYAVQCAKCFKLRLIPTQEEYEEIRHNFKENPWFCGRKTGVSCDYPADLDFDSTPLWIVDKPNIPKNPPGCKRILTMRSDFSKLDAFYVMPNGKRMRSVPDVERFLQLHTEYKGWFSATDFCFTSPKVMEGLFSGISTETGPSSANKRRNKKKI